MRVRTCGLAIVAALALVTSPSLAQRVEAPDDSGAPQPSAAPPPSYNEDAVQVPVDIRVHGGRTYRGPMVVTTFRPDGPGPFPLVVVLHGRSSESRHDPARYRPTRLAGYWVRRGFAVIIPTRVGYGALGVSPDLEDPGPCSDPDYRAMAEALVATTEAVARWARTQPWAEPSRLIVTGISVGGFGAVMASGRPPEGLTAIVNLAGGSGGRPTRRPGVPCATDRIADFVGRAGRTARVPSIWIYAENDLFWGAAAPRRWHAAYTSAGGTAELVMLPPVGDDGHRFPAEAFSRWRREVDRFIERLGFQIPRSRDVPAPTGFAEVDDAERVPVINAKVKADGYQKFLAADIPRAFAIGPDGAWAWSGGNFDAVARSLERCKVHAKTDCKLYAVDDAVVWQP